MRYSPAQYAQTLYELMKETPAPKRRAAVRLFLGSVARNSSLSLLPDIIREYEALSDRERGVKRVIVRSPERLSEAGVARRLHCRASVKSVRDFRLGGGVVIETDGLRVDNSVRRRLERVRKSLTG